MALTYLISLRSVVSLTTILAMSAYVSCTIFSLELIPPSLLATSDTTTGSPLSLAAGGIVKHDAQLLRAKR